MSPLDQSSHPLERRLLEILGNPGILVGLLLLMMLNLGS